MKKCSEYIKEITDYMSQYRDVDIFIENNLIKQDCNHDGKIIKEFDIFTEGNDLICSKCGKKIGYESCFGRVTIKK